MADDLGERTEEATPRRRQEARQQGNIARSPDLSNALLLMIFTLTAWFGARNTLLEGLGVMERALDGSDVGEPISVDGVWPLLASLAASAARVTVPLLAVAVGAAVVSHLLQTGWLFAPVAVKPSWARLNPAAGLRRILGLRGLVKASLDIVKVGLVLAVAVGLVLHRAPRLVTLPQLELIEAVQVVGRLLLELALIVAAILLLLGLIDFMFQRWRYGRDLRMSRQQVQDEFKQTEGDPDVKRRRMRLMQQIALQRIGAAVPKADVVVTNPEHVAVAIRYDSTVMRAPKVVAKGADLLALRIRQIALRHGIPIVERKPLARALYKSVEVNQEIPPQFYHAVAEILAYVYRLSGRSVA